MVYMHNPSLTNPMNFFNPGARISVNDGSLTIVAKNHGVLDKALEKVILLFVDLFYFSVVFLCLSSSFKHY